MPCTPENKQLDKLKSCGILKWQLENGLLLYERSQVMDLNVAVISGKLAAPPELRKFDSGSTMVRMLVTTRSETPRRRVDVVPITVWDTPQVGMELDDIAAIPVGTQVWVTGSIQRRFWNGSPEGRTSRLEIVAAHVALAKHEALL